MKIQYVNENLLPGHIGYFFVVLSFGGALLSLIAYLFHLRKQDDLSWKYYARTAFLIHGIGVLGIFVTLFYMIHSHMFQYNYVWSHSSKELPSYYMIACFWEGQEGSFLLWTFWQFILGGILIFTAKKWEAPVMVIMTLSGVMLASMLLGLPVPFLGAHSNIGSNPFTLLRQAFADQGLPLFSAVEMPNKIVTVVNGITTVDYTHMLVDGRGLNALLQNYWMVIHPPVLFLGFASTIVPFAFAMGSLFNKDYTGWVRPALPWAVFGGMVLGIGILMGGAWAYEALSFGGFWAWDPVENGILVPWLVFMAGLHCLQIYRARKTSLNGSYIFIILTYLLILYSTFLTRSGVLGDSSVHSFTDLGLSGQLLIFMFLFILLALFFMIYRWRQIPSSGKEENTSSREFWMFIGALILSLSALHIISITSIPVINKLDGLFNGWFGWHLKTNIAPPTDAPKTYHTLQIPFAIVIAILTGLGQFLRYHSTKGKFFVKKLLISLGIALVIAIVMMVAGHLYENWEYILLLFAASFAIAGNAEIFVDMIRKRTGKLTGPAIAHIGLGMILIGALIANAKKETISINTEGLSVDALEKATAKEQHENKVLFKDFPEKMNGYTVTYLGDSTEANHIYFKVNYKKIDSATNKIKEDFNLYPDIIYQRKGDQNMSFAPSSKHYLSKDIFTHITSASGSDTTFNIFPTRPDSLKFNVEKGQTFKADSFMVTVEDIVPESAKNGEENLFRVVMKLRVTDGYSTLHASPIFIIQGNQILHEDAIIREFGLGFVYNSVNPVTKTHELVILKGRRPERPYITLKAIIFPWINLLWFGSVVMVIGFMIALVKRIREYKTV